MRVLWLCSYPPFPPDFGGARRTYNLLVQAGRAGHLVDVLAFAPGTHAADAEVVAGLAPLCHAVHLVTDPRALPAALGGADLQAVSRKRRRQLQSLLSPRPYQYFAHYSPAMQEAIDRQAERESYDLVHVESSQMGYYRLPAHLPAVLDLHNVEYEVLGRIAHAGGPPARRLYNWAEYLKFRRAEPRLWRRFACLQATSERDAAAVRASGVRGRVVVAPNGVDTAFFHPPPSGEGPRPGAPPEVVFTGMMAYYPNHDAALYCAAAIWPRIHAALPGARWTIVGSEPPPEVQALERAGVGITVTGRVADVRPYVWASGASVVPLRSGGGTRLKIVEALAMGQPVISTTVGCEGIAVTPGRDLLVADDPQAFAAATVAVLQDRPRAAALGVAGRALAEREYSWPVVTRPMLEAWEALGRASPVRVGRVPAGVAGAGKI